MLCKELKVVNLNITEDNYEYKALFRLCSESSCMDVSVEALEEQKALERIKETFSLSESLEEIKAALFEKVMEASRLESKVSEGETCCGENKDKKTQRGIDSLSTS